MDELLDALVSLEQSDNPTWSNRAFLQILSLARSTNLGPDALENVPFANRDVPLMGTCGVKLLAELKKGLETSQTNDSLWRLVGVLLCWALDIHVRGKATLRAELARRARDLHGMWRHQDAGPDGGDDLLFESQLNFVLDTLVANVITTHGVLPASLDVFFARALLLPIVKDATSVRRAAGVPMLPGKANHSANKRLALMIEACLEKFLIRLHASVNPTVRWIANDLSRSTVAKAPRITVPAVLRAVLDKILSRPLNVANEPQGAVDGGPTPSDDARLFSFLLGTLDFSNPGTVEDEVSDDLILGEYNAVRHISEKVVDLPTPDEDLLVQRIFTALQRKWPLVFERFRLGVTLSILHGIETFLDKKLHRRQRLEPSCLQSLVLASIASGSAFPSFPQPTVSSALRAHEEEEDRRSIVELNYRISLLLALSSESPSENFSISFAIRPSSALDYCDDAVRLCAVALGCTHLEANLESTVCTHLLCFLDQDCINTAWHLGQVALQVQDWISALELWQFDFALAASRVREVISREYEREVREGRRSAVNSQQVLDEIERIEALFLGLHGLQSRGSIRHLQDAASFFVHFGRKLGFGQAGERFLVDASKALFDFRRYWECGNCRVMLGTCHLTRKEWPQATEVYQSALEAYEKCGAKEEADAVRSCCRAFATHATNPRDWDWTLAGDVAGLDRSSPTAIAHYFVVGAVGMGDPDLTVIRCVSADGRGAFDDAVNILEHGSLRRRMHGELRWVLTSEQAVVPQFFPAESIPHEEYGFWIQRVWPVLGEETPEHCPRRFGVIGEPRLVLEVNTRRGLNPLISAASVSSVSCRSGTLMPAHIQLDVPFGWMDAQDGTMPTAPPPYHPPLGEADDVATIPPPPMPPPRENDKNLATASAREKAPIADEVNGGRPKRKQGSGDPVSHDGRQETNEAKTVPPPPVSAQPSQNGEKGEGETDAQRRKREFLQKKHEREAASQQAQQQVLPESSVPIQEHEGAAQSRLERDLFDRAEQEQRERQQQQAKKVGEEAKLKGDQGGGTESDSADNGSTDLLLLRRRTQQGQAELPSSRKIVLVPANEMDDILAAQSALPQKKMTLVDDKAGSSKGRKMVLADDGKEAEHPSIRSPSTPPPPSDDTDDAVPTPPDSPPPPAPDEDQEAHIDEAAQLPPHSASRAFFNVGGARVTVEEATLVNKFLANGEAWISAQLLIAPKPLPVSVKLSSAEGTFEIYAEPSFQLLETVRLAEDMALDPSSSDPAVLELFDPDRVSEGLGPLHFTCDRPELFRAVVGSFRSTANTSHIL